MLSLGWISRPVWGKNWGSPSALRVGKGTGYLVRLGKRGKPLPHSQEEKGQGSSWWHARGKEGWLNGLLDKQDR